MNGSSDAALVPLADTMNLGRVLAQSGFFADARSEAQAVVKVLAGRELGFGPVASMTGINIIQGKPTLSANLMAAAVKRSGRYNYRVREMTDTVCTVEFFERNGDKLDSVGSSTFTAQDAHRAGTKNMDRFPRNMLFARAMSNGVRWYCPDVTGGPVYTPEELGADVDEDGDVVTLPKVVVEPPKVVIEQPKPDNGWDDLQGGGQQPKQKPAPHDDEVKPAKIRTANFNPAFMALLAKLDGADVPHTYYKAGGGVDWYHVTKSVAKCGFEEITEANVDKVIAALESRIMEKAQVTP